MTVEGLFGMCSSGELSLERRLADVDAAARSLQSHYVRVVQQVVWGGLLSLIFTFAAIAFGRSHVFDGINAAGLLVMIAGVAEGLARRYHERWIVERHRAERLRLLRFLWVVDPQHWDLPDAQEPALAKRLEARVDEILRLSESDMKQWCRDTQWPDVELPARPLSPTFVEGVIRSYVSTRLNHQLAYFVEMGGRRERLDALTRNLSAAGFGLALLLSVVELVLAFLPDRLPEPDPLVRSSMVFLMLTLPTTGAAARLLRTAFEFARNRQRFVVVAAELDRTRGRLEAATDPLDAARAMARAEFALENEHRAWLLLMTEAEWVG